MLLKFQKPISIFFRILIVLYAYYIHTHYDNYYADSVYWISLGVFGVVYAITYGRDGIFSFIRLLNDAVFIYVFVDHKSINDFIILSFILLPIINSPNHTGEKQSFILYILTFLIIYLGNLGVAMEKIVVPIIMMGAVIVVDFGRTRLSKIRDRVLLTIETYSDESYKAQKSFRLYKTVMDIARESFFPVYDIVCFQCNGDAITKVFNSHKFVWEFEYNEAQTASFLSSKEKVKCNLHLVVNKGSRSELYNIAIKVDKDDRKYLFVVFTSKAFRIFPYLLWLLGTFFLPIFVKLSNLFEFEARMKELESSIVSGIRQKTEYIQNAEKALHFIRNKLSNLENINQLFGDWEDFSEDQRLISFKILYEKRKAVVNSIKGIDSYASAILNKKSSPFHAQELEIYGIEWLYIWLRDQWETFFPIKPVEVKIDTQKGQRIFVNKLGMEIVLNNWISNMNKYGIEPFRCALSEDNIFYYIHLENGFKDSEVGTIKELVNDFNSGTKKEILKRKSFGLLHVKELIEDMKMTADISANSKAVILCLKIQKSDS